MLGQQQGPDGDSEEHDRYLQDNGSQYLLFVTHETLYFMNVFICKQHQPKRSGSSQRPRFKCLTYKLLWRLNRRCGGSRAVLLGNTETKVQSGKRQQQQCVLGKALPKSIVFWKTVHGEGVSISSRSASKRKKKNPAEYTQKEREPNNGLIREGRRQEETTKVAVNMLGGLPIGCSRLCFCGLGIQCPS